MALTRITSAGISDGVIDVADISDNTITGAKLASDIVISTTGSGTFSGDLTVDTDTLYVDSTNNRVGIGTTSPELPLHVERTTDGSATGYVNITRNGNTADNWIGHQSNSSLVLAADEGAVSSSSSINFRVDGSERMRIDSSGHAIIPNGVTLGTAAGTYNAANTIDDYEEGTFTPTLNYGTAATQLGSYVKVGNVCHCFINLVNLTDITTSAVIQVDLPFTPKSGDDYQSAGSVMYRYVTLLGNSSLSIFVNDNTSYFQIYQNNSTGNWNQLRYNEITNATNGFKIQITYFTA